MVESNGICSENQVGFKNSQVENKQVDPDLEDSEDDVAVKVLPDNAVSRRKLRMVMDLEDDDWCGTMVRMQVDSLIDPFVYSAYKSYSPIYF